MVAKVGALCHSARRTHLVFGVSVFMPMTYCHKDVRLIMYI